MREKFYNRHIGLSEQDRADMMKEIGVASMEELISKVMPENIILKEQLKLPEALSEAKLLEHMEKLASQNKQYKSYIGMGYYGTNTPPVIKRNMLENPGWYTPYTPYQAEISQGRLEALLNYQTAISSLTGMEMTNASMLDEATAAAEAMIMLHASRSRAAVKAGVNKFFVDKLTFTPTLEVLKTRADSLGIELVIESLDKFTPNEEYFGFLVQYPNSNGVIIDYTELTAKAHELNISSVFVADIMSLVLLKSPRDLGADVVVGNTQRFGLPMGYGGPHAAYFSTHSKYKRNIPGRLIGISVDAEENPALRMTLQTREQHIKKEKATSNICTAQALLANMVGMYAVYHGPKGLKEIATRIHSYTILLAEQLSKAGFKLSSTSIFDTLRIELSKTDIKRYLQVADAKKINFRVEEDAILISIGEDTDKNDIENLLSVFDIDFKAVAPIANTNNIKDFLRSDEILTETVFNSYYDETSMMRYIKLLEQKDISLLQSMIPLGSCTMKLNAASEMLPLSFSGFGNIHPFVPTAQAEGYKQMIDELECLLVEITGFDACSFQPNSGASGEYAGLLLIDKYHKSKGDTERNIVLIPKSAHGTNPASSVMAGLKVVYVNCDENGNVELEDIKAKAAQYKENLSAIMITYPSTHGIFEEDVIEIIDTIHQNGGLVYMDGANMNAQVGYTSPGFMGADVCHLNLHKTFAIPHGGGGPGMGPICFTKELAPFSAKHIITSEAQKEYNSVSSAHYGSASILTISYAYIKMLGVEGLKRSTANAILSANYIAAKLKQSYGVLYSNANNKVGHELILDCRRFKPEYGISVVDIAKRLIDYGLHAPTLSFPVADTLMIEPTESESKQEIDRMIEAFESIFMEIEEIKEGKYPTDNNVLVNAPHTAKEVTADEWKHDYSRTKAAYPVASLYNYKYWAPIKRINDSYGDRNLVCCIIDSEQ